MRHARLWAVLGLGLLTACQSPTPPVIALTLPRVAQDAAETGALLPQGTLVGRVQRLAGDGFRPAGGVTVTLESSGQRVQADAEGVYGFAGVPAGEVRLSVAEAGHHGLTLRGVMGGACGLPRMNLALVPETPSGQPADTVVIAGVATDPRGASLPLATVHCVDSLSRGGQGDNALWSADPEGFFVGRLVSVSPEARGGQALLTVSGRTPGGLAVESTGVVTLALERRASFSLIAGTVAFKPVETLRVGQLEGSTIMVHAGNLPQRRDELIFRITTPGGVREVAADAITGDTARFTLPDPAATRIDVLSLGLSLPGRTAPGFDWP